jgi:hypothetical protein
MRKISWNIIGICDQSVTFPMLRQARIRRRVREAVLILCAGCGKKEWEAVVRLQNSVRGG